MTTAVAAATTAGGVGGGGGGGAANNPCSGGPALVPRVPVSLTDLFLDIVSEFIIYRFVIPPRHSFPCAAREQRGIRHRPAPPRHRIIVTLLIPNNNTISRRRSLLSHFDG